MSNLNLIRFDYQYDIYESLLKHYKIDATVTRACELTCVLRNGQRNQYPHMGGETFKVIGFVKISTGVVMRLASTTLVEYRYAEAAIPSPYFSITLKRLHDGLATTESVGLDATEFVEFALNARTIQPAHTNRELLEAALTAEIKRETQQQMTSHANYGDW